MSDEKPDLWLQSDEDDGVMGDGLGQEGVLLIRDHEDSGDPAVFLRNTYDAAPELRDRLRQIVEHPDASIPAKTLEEAKGTLERAGVEL